MIESGWELRSPLSRLPSTLVCMPIISSTKQCERLPFGMQTSTTQEAHTMLTPSMPRMKRNSTPARVSQQKSGIRVSTEVLAFEWERLKDRMKLRPPKWSLASFTKLRWRGKARNELEEFACTMLMAFGVALRGEEITMVSLKGMLDTWLECTTADNPHIKVTLHGRFKGETGLR